MNTLFSNLLHKHSCCNIIVFVLAVGVLTPFAGAKHGSPTNDPPAVIEEACRQDDINIYFRIGKKETCGTIHIRPDGWWPWWQVPDPTNDTSNVSSTNGNNSAGTP